MSFYKIIKYHLCILLFALPVVSVAQAFQGVLDVTTIDKTKGNTDAKWYIGEGGFKISGSTAGKDGAIKYDLIFPKGENDAKFVTQGSGGAMVFNVTQGQMQNKTNYANVQLRKADGEKTIAGVKCHLYQDGDGKVTAWISDEARLSIDDLPAALVNFSEMKMMLTNGISGFPMEITAKDDGGAVVYSQTIKSIAKTSVDASEFSYSQYPKGEDVLKQEISNSVKK